MREGEPCRHILSAAGKAVAGGDRHDSYNEALLAVLGYGRRGCPGAALVIQRLKAAFIAEIANRATPAEAKAEFHRGLIGAIAIVANELPGNTCPDEVEDYIRSLDPNQPTTDDTPANADQAPTDPDNTTDDDNPLDRAVSRRYAELIINERAKEKLATLKASGVTPLHADTLAQFLNQPDEEESYRINQLWPAEGRVLLAAAAKTGKTTLVAANLIPALVDGTPFLNSFTPTPTTRRVALLNMEVGPRTLRRWMREADIYNTDSVLVVNLRGKAGSLQLNSDAGRKKTAQFLADHDTDIVILDPLAPLLASLGLDENSNADVAQFFAWWSETLSLAGVTDDLVVHHTGHAGDRSRGASRLLDEPDAIWTLTKGQEVEPTDQDPFPMAPRFLGAYGRDVDLPARRLQFDPTTRNLNLTDELQGAGGNVSRNLDTYQNKIVEVLSRGTGGMTASQIAKQVHAGQKTIEPLLKILEQQRRIQAIGTVKPNKNTVLVYAVNTVSETA
jgi:hypothetical protein